MDSLLGGVTKADIRTDPFPHIVIPNAMAADEYAELAATFPSVDRVTWAGASNHMPNNKRFALQAQLIIDAPDMPACWKSFVSRHSDPVFLEQVAQLFHGHWSPTLLKVLDGHIDGHSSERLQLSTELTACIRMDARIEINTPVRDRPSSSRGPHLDTPNRLYSGLFYMRAPEDDSVGGELLLYRWRRRPDKYVSAYELPAEDVEVVGSIPYAANQLVMFPQGLDALHGVGVRHPTPHTRRYVFITAELAEDWLSVEAAA